MEYVAGKDLEMFLREIGYLKEDDDRPVQQVMSSASLLHQRLIEYGDNREYPLWHIGQSKALWIWYCHSVCMRKDVEGGLCFLALLESDFLTRKSYDGLAGDKWSLGIVLYVMITSHFPYVETTLSSPPQCVLFPTIWQKQSHYHCTITHGPYLVQGNNR